MDRPRMAAQNSLPQAGERHRPRRQAGHKAKLSRAASLTAPPFWRFSRTHETGAYPSCNVGKLDVSPRLGYNVAQEEMNAMPDKSVVRARIDDRTKREAAAALKKIGLTVSDAFRLLLVRVAAEKDLPFEPLNPNAETVAAMKAARRGELVKVGKAGKLLRSLNAGG